MSKEDAEKSKTVCDRGWNDPPVLSYEEGVTREKRTPLTKRVAYPEVGSTQPPTSACLSPGISPILTTPPVIPTQPLVSSTIPPLPLSDSLCQQQLSLESLLDNFNISVENIYGDGKEKQKTEVQRRLKMMENMWKEDKLNTSVKEKLHQISEDIKEGNLESADTLQRSLMVEHASLCSSWMSGIRHLLNSKRALEG